MCVSGEEGAHAHVGGLAGEARRRVRSPGGGDTGCCELSRVNAGLTFGSSGRAESILNG